MKSAATLDDKVLLLAALSDATRLRLLALLSRHELSVVELTHVTELGQSKVSTHLARLREQGLVSDRRAGTSTYYRFNDAVAEGTLRLWETVAATLTDRTLEHDRARAERVIEAREDKQSWHERMAGELERHYSPGRTWDSLARAFTGLVRLGDVLDVGAGDGTVAEMLSPQARRYVCLDVSRTLGEAACRRLAASPRASVLRGDMHALPFPDASFDELLFLNVLTYADKPALALTEAGRVLRPRGRLVLVTLARHDHAEAAAQYGHRQPGFQPRWLKKTLEARNFCVERAEVTARERKSPHFEVITCFATKS
jgi:DNA-binding transcriptional ArsR family regulator